MKESKSKSKKGTRLVGQRFGLLTVVEKAEETQNNYLLWRCACDCGGEILANTKQLSRGTISNCGCIPKTTQRKGPIAEDLTGQIFGDLTVIKKMEKEPGRVRWWCRCECGNEKAVASRDLKAGKTKSCGCKQHQKGRNILDIKDQKFGRLTALYPTEERDKKSSVYWHCLCDCGNEVNVTADRLMHGKYQSCGCLKKEYQKDIFKRLHMVDGTCVEWLEKRKHRSDNTSGFRGVYRMKTGKYRVSIGFKGQRNHLGTYEDFDEAVAARLKAEEQLHDGFVSSYYEWKERADVDPEWAKQHPFVYDVDK